MTLIVNWAEGVEEQLVGVAANIPNSDGCPAGQYKEGEWLFVAVSKTLPGVHPVWGASANVALACTHCEVTNFVMPASNLFMGPLYFAE